MNILIAPNAYKGTLNAREASDAILEGMKKALPHAKFTLCPLADGGDGFLDVLQFHSKALRRRICIVRNPENKNIRASFLYDKQNKHAYVESAEGCGMKTLTRNKKDVLHDTSEGAGQLILRAMDAGAEKITMGIGGTATNDGGLGMLRALGFKFYTGDKKEIIFPCGLSRLRSIETKYADPRLPSVKFYAACDVRNVLLAKEGATYTYGKQKGANGREQKILECALKTFARKINENNGKNVNLPFCGAGGGLAAGMAGMLNAECDYGFIFMAEISGIENKIKNADVVITGEGKVDAQTKFGKVPYFVAKLCRKHGVPCICIAGSIGSGADALYKEGMTAVFASLLQPVNETQLMNNAAEWLARTSCAIGKILYNGKKIYKRGGNREH